MITDSGMLYMEPRQAPAIKPIIDSRTRKMTAAFRQASEGDHWMGWHTCSCGAESSSCDFILPNKEETNSLCVHYLAWHRDEVSALQLQKVEALDCGEVYPNLDELASPRRP